MKPTSTAATALALVLLVAPPSGADNPQGDANAILHCATQLTYDQLAIANAALEAFWASPYGQQVKALKCQAWHTACLGGIQPYGLHACKIAHGAGIVSQNNCYTVLRVDDGSTYYYGDPEATSYEQSSPYSYWRAYHLYDWDYPTFLMSQHECFVIHYENPAFDHQNVFKESNGLKGLQFFSVWYNGVRYPHDTWIL